MMDGNEIGRMQDAWVVRWHGTDTVSASVNDLDSLILRNHRANFDLWHEEDKARDPRASDTDIARVKRTIDQLNQQRNDVVEEIDEWLWREAPEQPIEAPLHSETPGMMIDRMSILALKIFHTREQMERPGVSTEHRTRNLDRLHVLEAQREDLAVCLGLLWSEVLAGTRRVKIYRQMKMYNDPALNPAIYGALKADGNDADRR